MHFAQSMGTSAANRNDDVAVLVSVQRCPSGHVFDAWVGGNLSEQRGFETGTLNALKHLLRPARSQNTGIGNDQRFAATEVAPILSRKV
jgi:hypothetical protein